MEFLHRLDALAGRVERVDTSVARLRAATFLDGRETFWTGRRVLPLAVPDTGTLQTSLRWIFHVGFCGSTLLTRLLDKEGATLALREPQCLVDLSDQQLALAAGSDTVPALPKLLAFVASELAGVAPAGEQVLVKPSCWANPLLPPLQESGLLRHALFVSMDRRAYVAACFRGGRERLAYVARCAAHIARHVPDGSARLDEAIRGVADPLDQLARIAALLHELQERMFAHVGGGEPGRRLDHAELVADPERAVARARNALGLAAAPSTSGTAEAMRRDAKDPQRAFSGERRSQEDRATEAAHGKRFDAALAWVSGGS